jgi:uncharacterized membrane protein
VPSKRLAGWSGLAIVVVATALTLGLGFLQKSPCITGDWGTRVQYRRLCYADIFPLYQTESLQENRLPYVHKCEIASGVCDEYPPVTMYAMRLAAWPVDTSNGFFGANAIILALAGIATAVTIYSLVGARALYFVLAPTLLVYAFLNWDLLAVAFATGALWAYVRGRYNMSGVLLAIGATAKLYPGLFIVPLLLERLRLGRRSDAAQLGSGALMTWALLNVPFILVAREEWWTFFKFNSQRGADFDSLWAISCGRVFVGIFDASCPSVPLLNVMAGLLFAALAALTYWFTVRRNPNFPHWTFAFPLVVLFLLTSKVYSPQYSLWILPFFALVLPNRWLFAAFTVTDMAVFVTRFSWLGTLEGLAGFSEEAFQTAIVLRALVLITAVVMYVRRGGDVALPEPGPLTTPKPVPQPAPAP